MPIPLIPIIAAGASLAGSGINAASTAGTNKKARKFAQQQALQQREWSLSDWAMQNEYNHPSSQMARLREAGLNPNLVYGNGADTSSGPIRNSEPATWRPEAPQVNLSGAVTEGLSAYYDTQIKQAQIDNLRAQNTVATQDALLKAAQIIQTTAATGKTTADTQSTLFDNQLKSELKQTSMEAAKLGVEKQKADISYTLNAQELAIASTASSLREAAERILRSRAEREQLPAQRQLIYAQIESLKRDARLKDADLNLKEKGIQPGDNLFLRMLGQMLTNPKELREKYGLKLTDKIKEWNLYPGPK